MKPTAVSASLAVEPIGPGRWRVPGRAAPYYDVEIAGEIARCSCGDWIYRRRACRHICQVWEYLRLAPIAPAPTGPAFDDVPLPDPPAEDEAFDVDSPELEGDPFAEMPSTVMQRWRAAKERLRSQAA